jgi:hypothetical protein
MLFYEISLDIIFLFATHFLPSSHAQTNTAWRPRRDSRDDLPGHLTNKKVVLCLKNSQVMNSNPPVPSLSLNPAGLNMTSAEIIYKLTSTLPSLPGPPLPKVGSR